MKRLFVLAVAAMGAQEPASAPATRPAGELLAFVQKKSEGLAGLESEITLRESVAQLEEPIVSRGSMLFDRRGRLRVEIREPRKSLLLARGERIEVYRGETAKPEFSGVDPTGACALLPLLGLPDAEALGRIRERFDMAEEGGGPIRALRLTPRSPDDPLARSVRELRFEVGAEDGLPRAFEWIGRTGDSTRYEMASVRPLAKVDASRFERP